MDSVFKMLDYIPVSWDRRTGPPVFGGQVQPAYLSEGFADQILHFCPSNIRDALAKHPLGTSLSVPDLGWFPHAAKHYRERPQGSNEHILIYCQAGRGWFEIAGRKQDLLRGQVLLIPRGKAHRYGASEADPWSIHWAHFSGDNTSVYLQRAKDAGFTIDAPKHIEGALQRLFSECYRALAPGHKLHRFLLVAHVFYHLLGVLLLEQEGQCAEPMPYPAVVVKGLEFMQSSSSRHLTLSEVANHAGLSVSRYSAVFKRYTGATPIEYHTGLRIQAACRLMTTTDQNVSEISGVLGFDDPFYFSRLFKKIMGVSPSHYRHNVKG